MYAMSGLSPQCTVVTLHYIVWSASKSESGIGTNFVEVLKIKENNWLLPYICFFYFYNMYVFTLKCFVTWDTGEHLLFLYDIIEVILMFCWPFDILIPNSELPLQKTLLHFLQTWSDGFDNISNLFILCMLC